MAIWCSTWITIPPNCLLIHPIAVPLEGTEYNCLHWQWQQPADTRRTSCWCKNAAPLIYSQTHYHRSHEPTSTLQMCEGEWVVALILLLQFVIRRTHWLVILAGHYQHKRIDWWKIDQQTHTKRSLERLLGDPFSWPCDHLSDPISGTALHHFQRGQSTNTLLLYVQPPRERFTPQPALKNRRAAAT